MDSLTIMRRADGKLFTVKVKGQEHLALWPSLQSAMRYKKRNPQLLIFIPAVVASPFGRKSLIPLRQENMELFLLIDAGGSHLSDGRKISWDELETNLLASSVNQAQQPEIPASPQTTARASGQATPNFIKIKSSAPVAALNRFEDEGGNPG